MPNGAGDMMIDRTCEPEGERFEKFKELATAAKANGSLILGQINHPGRQVQLHLSATAVSASDLQLGLSTVSPSCIDSVLTSILCIHSAPELHDLWQAPRRYQR